MLAVYAMVKKIEFKFQLDPSDLSEKVEKKLGNLGFPLIDIQYFLDSRTKCNRVH